MQNVLRTIAIILTFSIQALASPIAFASEGPDVVLDTQHCRNVEIVNPSERRATITGQLCLVSDTDDPVSQGDSSTFTGVSDVSTQAAVSLMVIHRALAVLSWVTIPFVSSN